MGNKRGVQPSNTTVLIIKWLVRMCHNMIGFHLFTIIQFVGFHNFDSIVRDAAAFDLLTKSQQTFELTCS